MTLPEKNLAEVQRILDASARRLLEDLMVQTSAVMGSWQVRYPVNSGPQTDYARAVIEHRLGYRPSLAPRGRARSLSAGERAVIREQIDTILAEHERKAVV